MVRLAELTIYKNDEELHKDYAIVGLIMLNIGLLFLVMATMLNWN